MKYVYLYFFFILQCCIFHCSTLLQADGELFSFIFIIAIYFIEFNGEKLHRKIIITPFLFFLNPTDSGYYNYGLGQIIFNPIGDLFNVRIHVIGSPVLCI